MVDRKEETKADSKVEAPKSSAQQFVDGGEVAAVPSGADEVQGREHAKKSIAQEHVEDAAKAAKAGPKTTDDGQPVGLDGKNPVSNENPDPRAVTGGR